MLAAFSDVLIAFRNTFFGEGLLRLLPGQGGGENIRGSGNPENGPPEPWDPATEEDLQEITSRLEGESAVFVDTVGQLERETRTEVVAMWEAFSGFARAEMGVEPETLVRVWFGLMLPEIEAIEEALDLTEVDPEKLEEYESMLWELWSELLP